MAFCVSARSFVKSMPGTLICFCVFAIHSSFGLYWQRVGERRGVIDRHFLRWFFGGSCSWVCFFSSLEVGSPPLHIASRRSGTDSGINCSLVNCLVLACVFRTTSCVGSCLPLLVLPPAPSYGRSCQLSSTDSSHPMLGKRTAENQTSTTKCHQTEAGLGGDTDYLCYVFLGPGVSSPHPFPTPAPCCLLLLSLKPFYLALPIPARMDVPPAVGGVEPVHALQDALRKRCGAGQGPAGQKGDVLHHGPRSLRQSH